MPDLPHARGKGWGGSLDDATYQVDVKGATGPFTVNAELLFQSVSYRFVRDLLVDKIELTDRFGKYYTAADRAPAVVAKIEATKTK